MRQLHKAGEKAFIDYAGITIPIVNQHTGEIRFNAEMFVAVLGASNYTYAEASRSQKSVDWLQSHARSDVRVLWWCAGDTRARQFTQRCQSGLSL